MARLWPERYGGTVESQSTMTTLTMSLMLHPTQTRATPSPTDSFARCAHSLIPRTVLRVDKWRAARAIHHCRPRTRNRIELSIETTSAESFRPRSRFLAAAIAIRAHRYRSGDDGE
jgi:hypothetical protein